MVTLNVIFAVFNWWYANKFETWSGFWWCNMLASALNGVIVLRAVL